MPGDPEMESRVRFVLEAGEPTEVPALPLNYFGLPYDDLKFYQLVAPLDGGKTKAIQVRYRNSGDVDVFLLERTGSEGRGFFYLTGTHGRLTKAAYFDEKPEAVDDAQERFENELGFWKHWRRDQLKGPS